MNMDDRNRNVFLALILAAWVVVDVGGCSSPSDTPGELAGGQNGVALAINWSTIRWLLTRE